MNVYEHFRDSAQKYYSELQQKYFNWGAPNVKIYKLDKINTPVDELYQESHQRNYLPYFTLPSIYHIQPPTQELNKFAIQEQYETVIFGFNFNQMVLTIEKIKNMHTSEIIIENVSDNEITIEKTYNLLNIKIDGASENINLLDNNYNTIEKISNYLNSFHQINAICNKGDKKSIDIINFEETNLIRNIEIVIYSRYKKFDGTENIIDNGDLILTKEGDLYEVVSVFMDNKIMYEDIGYIVKGEMRSLANIYLPFNGLDKVFDVRDKYKIYNPER